MNHPLLPFFFLLNTPIVLCVLNSFADLFPLSVFHSQHPLKLAYNFVTENAEKSLADCVWHVPYIKYTISIFFLNSACYKHEIKVELGKPSRNKQMVVIECIIDCFVWPLTPHKALNLTPKIQGRKDGEEEVGCLHK